VDETIWNTVCANVVVINAQYSLERIRDGVQLSFVAQVMNVPARQTAEASTVAVLEYRSMPMPFEASDDPAELAPALERFLAAQRPAVINWFQDAGVDMADMVASRLRSASLVASVETLGNTRRQLLCDDCEKSDWILARKPARLWVQPDDEPLAIRSLPLRP